MLSIGSPVLLVAGSLVCVACAELGTNSEALKVRLQLQLQCVCVCVCVRVYTYMYLYLLLYVVFVGCCWRFLRASWRGGCCSFLLPPPAVGAGVGAQGAAAAAGRPLRRLPSPPRLTHFCLRCFSARSCFCEWLRDLQLLLQLDAKAGD